MYRKIFTLLICIYFSATSFSQNCSVSVLPTINTSCDGLNSVIVTVDLSNIDINNWDLNNDISFTLSSPSSVLSPIINWSLVGDVIEVTIPDSLTVSIGDYLFLVTTPDTDSGVCTISPVSFNISDQIDLSLEYDVTDPLCLNTDGFFSGSLDGPSGIYSVYFDGQFTLETSLGINEIDFSFNSSNSSTSSIIGIQNVEGLETGDQIGVFFSSNNGLICSGVYDYVDDGQVIPFAAWGDDSSTPNEQEGLNEGDEFLFLVKKQNGVVYNVNTSYLEYAPPDITATNTFQINGISVIDSFSLGFPFVESFETPLSVGTHTLEIFNSAFCSVYQNDNIVVNSPDPITVSTSFSNTTCESTSDGSVTIEASGGSGQFLYSLFGPPGFDNIILSPESYFDNLPIGSYFVFVKDSGCDFPDPNTYPVSIGYTESFSVNLIDQVYDCQTESFNNVLSVDGTNISFPISVDVTNLTTGEIINLSSNEDVISVDQLESGFYYVDIISNSGCQNNLTLVVDEYSPIEIVLNSPSQSLIYSGFDLSCNGTQDGWLEAEVTGGYGNYTYSWSNGASSQDISGLSAGLYSLVVTDEYGCSSSIEQELLSPSNIESSFVVSDYNGYSISCFGENNGSIDLTVSGGIAPYDYSWSSGDVTQDLNNLEPGFYSVIITDQNGCENTIENIEITEPNELTVSIIQSNYSSYGVLCNGSNNGFIDITVDGGAGLYTYSWDNGSNTEDLTGLDPGNYDLIVSDANGCNTSVSITITEPDSLSISSTQSDYNGYSLSCNGSNNGFIDITVTGGTGVYTYAWSNGLLTEDLIDLGAGIYNVVVTDSNGCVATESFEITEPDELIVSSTLSDFTGYAVSCNGQNDGFIDITVSGGVEPYAYAWNNGANTEDLTDLGPGEYELSVIDDQGCESFVQFEINEPEDILISYLSSSYNGYGLSASNSSDGFIDITVTGGTGTYIYAWDNGETTEDLVDIGEGIYSLTASDENNCVEEFLSFEISAPPPINLSISTPLLGWDFENGVETNVSCYGSGDGSIDLTVSGGAPPYYFEWTNSNGVIISTDEDIDGLTAGTYYVSVTDDNLVAENSPPIVITEPSSFTVNYEIIPPLCGEELAEVVILDINGSLDPSDDENFEDPNAENGWYYAFSIYFDDNENSLISYAFNNVLPITFEFNPTLYGDGTYTLQVSHVAAGDNPGICSQLYTFELEYISPINIDNSQIVDASCGLDNGSIELSFSGGDGVYSYDWTGPNGFSSSNNNLFNLGAGLYNLTVNDGSGCEFSDSYEIQGNDGLSIISEETSNTCVGSSLGSINIEASGGLGDYTFSLFYDSNTNLISTNNTGEFNGLSIGLYYVEVSDPQCDPVSSSVLVVDNLSTLFSTLDSQNSTLGVCSGQSTGYLDINVTGGQPFPDGNYVYVWTASNGGVIPSGQETNQDISDLPPGDYSVFVFDDSGCPPAGPYDYSIVTLDDISVDIEVVSVPTCYGDPAVIEYVINGEGIFDVSIDNGQELIYDENIINADAGSLVFEDNTDACASNNSIAFPNSIFPANTDINIGDQIGLFFINENGDYTCSNVITWLGVTDAMAGCGDDGLTVPEIEGFQSGDEMIFLVLDQTGPDAGTIYNTEVVYQDLPGFETVFVPNGLTAIQSIYTTSTYTQADATELVVDEAISGTYTISISNENCSYVAEFEVICPDIPLIIDSNLSDYNGYEISCSGANNGEINTSVLGGVAPYTYTLENSDGIPIQSGGLLGCSETETSIPEFIYLDMYAGNTQTLFDEDNPDIYLNSGSHYFVSTFQTTWSLASAWAQAYSGYLATFNAYNEAWTILYGTNPLDDCLLNGITCVNDDNLELSMINQWWVGMNTDLFNEDGYPDFSSLTNWYNGELISQSTYDLLGLPLFCEGCENNQNMNSAFLYAQDGITDLSIIANSSFLNDLGANYYDDDGNVILPFILEIPCDTDLEFTDLLPGDYTLTVLDANGCQIEEVFSIEEPDPLEVTFNISSPSCSELSDASVEALVEGGVGGYTYSWLDSDGLEISTTNIIDNVLPGNYTVFIYDENFDSGNPSTSCSVYVQLVEILDATPVQIDDIISSDYNGYGVSCYGEENGFINISVSGGTPPYNYFWLNEDNQIINAGTNQTQNLPAGEYNITVWDSNYDQNDPNTLGCYSSTTVILTEPPAIDAVVYLTDYNGFSVSCKGASDASIDLEISGGTGNYNFEWMNGEITEDLNNVSAGLYEVTVTDDNNCGLVVFFEVTEPELLEISASYSDYNGYGISCNSGNDGFIDLTISGGSGVYTYSWSNGENTQDLNDLQSGTYIISVIDSNGCESSEIYILEEPDPLVFNAEIVEIPCYGGEGDILLTWSGGVPFETGSPYNYIFPTGTDPDGTGGPNGTVISIANSAIGPNGQTGYFSEIATDANGCQVQFEVYMTQPDEIPFSYTTSNYNGYNISCNGGSNGFINAIAEGDFPPFSYSWTGPNGFISTESFIEDLTAGTYTLTIEDDNGCQVLEEITLNEPNEIEIIPTTSTTQFNGFGVSCNGASDGWINISVTGGTDDYSYLWTGPDGFESTNPSISSLTAGNYYIEVIDNNNYCIGYQSVLLPSPDVLSLGITISDINSDNESNDYNGYSVSCFGASDGTITVYVTGGSGSYIFILQDSDTGNQLDLENVTYTGDLNQLFQVSYTFNNLIIGNYTVQVQDLNSCEAILTDIILTEPNELFIESLVIGDASCYGYSDGFINLDVDGGLAPYTYTLSNSSGQILISELNTTETNLILDQIPADDYQLLFSDKNNCLIDMIIEVSSPEELLANINIQETTCFSMNDGSIEFDFYGGVSPYDVYFYDSEDTLIYSIEDSEYLLVSDLFQGSFYVEIIDDISCSNILYVDLGGPAEFEINYETINASCEYSFDGSIFLNIEGGLEPYSITSETLDFEYGVDIENIMPGWYNLLITDFEGCQGDLALELAVDNDNCNDIPSGFTPNGDGYNDFWVVGGADYLVDANVQVYNRWGQRVFYSENNKDYWDGKCNNKDLPIADYYYIIEPVKGQVVTGRITIKR